MPAALLTAAARRPQDRSSIPVLFKLTCTHLQGEATAALAAIAVGNRTKLPEQPLADMGSSTAVRVGLWDVIKHPRLRLRLVIMVYIWFVVSMGAPFDPESGSRFKQRTASCKQSAAKSGIAIVPGVQRTFADGSRTDSPACVTPGHCEEGVPCQCQPRVGAAPTLG